MSDSKIGYEIDFLPVGNGERSGDAIAMRYGVPGAYTVMVYDGGTKSSGEALVEHIRKHYETDFVDHVVCSHPDGDHASGLTEVLENLEVGELWMHRPWEHSSLICDYFVDGRITSNSLAERLKAKMSAAYALEKLAKSRDIPIKEPFLGEQIGQFVVFSPEEDWYVHELIKEFEKSPDQHSTSALDRLIQFARSAVAWVVAGWTDESLREDIWTSAENESSVVLYGEFDGKGVMFTGDSGVLALGRVADLADEYKISLPDRLKFIQIPHHGSRNNVSPSVLNRIVGPPVEYGSRVSKTAFVSASSGSTTHPRKSVLNAFIRRGAKIGHTNGGSIYSYYNLPLRDGWQSLAAVEFSSQVEDWD